MCVRINKKVRISERILIIIILFYAGLVFCLPIAHSDASGHTLLKQSTFLVGLQGKTCLEAALLGKPALIFGMVHPPALSADRACKESPRVTWTDWRHV